MLSALVVDAQRKKKVYSYQEGYEYSYNRNLDSGKGTKRLDLYRDDMLYHWESAYVTPKDRGNYSLLKYSRWGLGNNWEISTNIGEAAFRPIIGGKYQWAQWGKLNIISSYLTLSTFYPGMTLAEKFGIDEIIKPGEEKAQVCELGHELLYSHVWSSDPNCSTGNPYLVLTLSMANYWGIGINEVEMRPFACHVLAPRSNTYGKSGYRMHLKGWVDGYANKWLTYHVGGYIHITPGLKSPVSLEGRGEAEFFITPICSVSFGGILSFGYFEGVKPLLMPFPMVDVSFYFGKKQSVAGLFDLKF